MAANRVHHLLVCEKGDRLVGVISDRDLLTRRGKMARDVMTPDPCSITPDTPLGPAITCLISRHISCLPVVEHGRLCGVITTIDLALITQCVLQLWLRTVHEMQGNPVWTEELAKVAEMVRHDLEHQEMRFVGLTQTLGRLALCAEDKPCNLVIAQIEEILAATKRLTDLIAKTHGALEQQRQQTTTVVDSQTDPLTGLSSRRGLEEILETMLSMKTVSGQPFSLLLMAVQQCPGQSDRQGAELAPHMLRALAEWVVKGTRGTDLVARYRTDAFAIVLPHTGPEGASIAGQRIRQVLQKNLCEREILLAIRLAAVSAMDGEQLEGLLARADAALAAVAPGPGRGGFPDNCVQLDSTHAALLET
jgi:diguanylate cyclase (GGDEF)-like protein